MASSNRHWPSMFKSKPSHHHHRRQHDIINNPTSQQLVPNGHSNCHRPPYATTPNSSGGLEDQRTPEPKPRWNPRPEQIRILEAIFNSGMVNPPRDEIRKIRAQLQEYGQVGDANVFYWFQNRKSRSKHKLRLQHINSKQHKSTSAAVAAAAPSSSSSSSSERSSPCNKAAAATCFSMGFNSPPHVNIDVSNNMMNSSSPTSASVNQTTSSSFFHALPAGQEELPAYFFPVMNNNGPVASANNNFSTTQGFWFSELANVVHVNTTTSPPDLLHGPCTNLLLSEIMNNNNNNGMTSSRKNNNNNDQEMMKGALKMEDHKLNYNGVFTSACSSSTTGAAVNVAVPSPMSSSHISAGLGGVGEGGGAGTGGGVLMGAGGAAKCMVFINDVAFEVAAGPFNVREAFGDDAVLIHSSGHPVLTNEWGVTLHSLHHGAFYYLI